MTASVSVQLFRQGTALVVSSNAAHSSGLAASAAIAGWRTIVCSDIEQAIPILDQHSKLEIGAVVLIDEGIDQAVHRIVGDVKRRNPGLPLIVAWTSRHEEWAVAMDQSDTIQCVASTQGIFSTTQILAAIKYDKNDGAEPSRHDARKPNPKFGFSSLIGNDPAFRAAISNAAISATGLQNVILEGERGTGRRTLAHAIHYASPRRHLPVRTLNVRSTGEAALELSLFGHERGAFVGAFEAQAGLLQQCHDGTLIVEGADLLPLTIQDHLADALSDKWVRPLGASDGVSADVRILALSEKSLGQLALRGLYSKRLFKCLNAKRIFIPPLRQRGEDVGLIASHFVDLLGPAFGVPELTIDPSALASLTSCEWRGNVRKLQVVLCDAAAFADSNAITVDDLAKAMCKRGAASGAADREFSFLDEGIPLRDQDGDLRKLADIEKDIIQMALGIYKGSMTQVAARLGIGRSTLYRKLTDLAERDE